MTTHATLVLGRGKVYEIAVDIGGEQVTLTEDAAQEYWDALNDEQRSSLFYLGRPAVPKPIPPSFGGWWATGRRERRTWQAAFVTADQNQPVSLDKSMDWTWGFPVGEAARLLDHYSAAGWRLVHVSEDHGLYSGADALNEAYPVRVRYLLAKD